MSEKEFFSPKSGGDGKQETQKLFQMLEVKLGLERVEWQQTKSQIRTFRTVSFFFLFVLIVGALFAGYFIFLRAQEERSIRPQQTTLPDR